MNRDSRTDWSAPHGQENSGEEAGAATLDTTLEGDGIIMIKAVS